MYGRQYSYVSLLLQTCANVKNRRRRTWLAREFASLLCNWNKVFIISILEPVFRSGGINFAKRIRAAFFLHVTVSTRFPQRGAGLESSQTHKERPV
jgi:hypothetical protein